MPTAAAREATQAQRGFHALSDETRLRLIEMLRAGEQCVCDLTDSLETTLKPRRGGLRLAPRRCD